MARTVLPFVGAAVGFWVGGPTGAQIGFALGGVVGNAVDPVKNIGPRIGETGAQTSAEGAPRGIVYGTVSVTGNVIASGPLIKADVEGEGGGKGGPVNVTERCYRFYAIRICEGPIGGVLRIWEDDKLVYDVRPGSIMVAESEAWMVGNVFYNGGEDQLPDVFNTLNINEDSPAYRGTAYMTFGFRDLTDRRGSIPQYRFEVAQSIVTTEVFEPLVINPWTPDIDGRMVHGTDGGRMQFIGGVTSTTWTDYETAKAANAAEYGVFYTTDPVRHTAVTSLTYLGFATDLNHAINQLPGGATTVDSPNVLYYRFSQDLPANFNDEVLSCPAFEATFDSTPRYTEKINNVHPAVVIADANPFASHPGYYISVGCTRHGFINYVPELRARRIPSPRDGLTGATIVTGTAKQLVNVKYVGDVLYQNAIGPLLFPGDPNYNSTPFWSAARDAAIANGTLHADVAPWPVEVSEYCSAFETSVGGTVTLASIVNDIHARCDMPYGVTTELTDEVAGLVLAGDYTGADAINTLRGPYFFDKAEANGQIYYPKRGAAVVDTLTIDDLIDEPDSQMREQALEYPKKFHLFYQHANSGYATVKATSQRSSPDVRVVGEATAQVPVVLNEDQAAQTAHKMHKVSWAEAEGEVKFSVPWSFIARVPSNPIGLYLRNRVSRLRIADMALADGVIDVTCRHDRQSAYTSNVTGVPIPDPTPPPATIVGSTDLVVLDIPSLRDTDDDLNLYYAVTGAQPAWHGAVIQQSRDGGGTWSTVGVKTNASTVGELVAGLDDASADYTDTTNAVTVRLYRPTQTLESISEAAFLSEGGAFALENTDGSWEILQAKDWAQDSAGDWTGTTLHRGRLNTHTNSHLIGQRFVLLETTLHVPMSSSLIGQTLTHRAPSLDQAPELAETQDMVYVGRSQIEWPVASLETEVAGSTLTAVWAPRHRFGTDDAPVASINFTGYRYTLDNAVTVRTVDTTTPGFSEDISAMPAPLVLTVASTNRITGPGEPTSVLIGGEPVTDTFIPSGITVTSAARFAHQIDDTIVTCEQNGGAGAARFFDLALTPLGIYGAGSAPMGCASVGNLSYHLFDLGGGSSRLVRFDRTSSYSVPTHTRNFSVPITDLVLCGTDVWVASPSLGEAMKLDPTTLANVSIVNPPGGPVQLASDGAKVYASGTGTVQVIDNATLAITSFSLVTGGTVWDMVIAAGKLLVSQVNVTAYNPATGAVLKTFTTAPGSDATLSATGNIIAIDRGTAAPALIVQAANLQTITQVQAAVTMLGVFAMSEDSLLIVDSTPQAELWI